MEKQPTDRTEWTVLTRSYRDFIQHYQAEIRSGRPEYADHKPVLDSFLSRAEASTGKQP